MSIIYDWLKQEERKNDKLQGELNKVYKKIKKLKEEKRNDVLDGIKYDLTRRFYSFQDFLYDIFYNINDIRSQLSENVRNIITEMQKNKLPLYEGNGGYLDNCKDLSECYIKLAHHWSTLYAWDDNPFPVSSNAIEKVFALIPYSKKDMETKLPIRVMENIFEFVDFYFEKFDRPFAGEYKYTKFKEDRKKTMIAALGCVYGLHISPKYAITKLDYPRDFATKLSAEELANNFENNLKNFKNRFEKGEDNYDEIDKEVYLERPSFKLVDRGGFALSPDTPDEQRFYRDFDLPDYFIHDYYGEFLNKIEQENKKKQKFCAKNDKKFKDAEYILANRKLREKFLGEEYDDNIEIGVANKNKELLKRIKSKNVEK